MPFHGALSIDRRERASGRCTNGRSGRLAIRVHSEAPPGPGFEPVAPDLEDVYFLAIHGARGADAPVAAS